jgi:hypothetical protein
MLAKCVLAEAAGLASLILLLSDVALVLGQRLT